MTPAEIQRLKDLLPTTLGSDEIREQIARDILRRSVFSARMASAGYLAKVREVCAQMLDGAISQADARNALEAILEGMGHSMQDDGGIKNPIAIRRLNLIVETQTKMAASVAQLSEQTAAVVEMWPAWHLTRTESRALPRPDWAARWRAAGEACGFEGALKDRFIALKSSPIWAALGNGSGGFTDALGNPYPPFAYSSGMGWVDVDRETCEKLGLVPGSAAAAPSAASLSPSERDIAEAAKRYGFDFSEGIA